MFGGGYSRATGEVERRLRSIEQLLQRDGGRGAARAGGAADPIAETRMQL